MERAGRAGVGVCVRAEGRSNTLSNTFLANPPFVFLSNVGAEAKNIANGSYNAVYYEALCNLTCQLLQDRVQLSVQATMDVW